MTAPEQGPAKSSFGRAAAIYTAARFGLFLLFSLLVWAGFGLAGYEVNGWLLVIVGFALSSVVGYLVLAGPREDLAHAVAARRGDAV